MRRPAPLVFLAVLAACTVTTTGAPCTSDLNCPSDQGCGSDRVCSVAALSCPGHGTDGECKPGTSCSAGQVATCTATSGVCSTSQLTPCTDPGTSCAASGGGAACACPTTNACTHLDATQCSPAGDAVRRCLPVVAGSSCLTWQVETSCAGSGLVCSASACVCPANPGTAQYADPLHGTTAGAPLHATGVQSPAACRFSTLTEALAAAASRGAGASVVASGWTAAVPGGVVLFTEPGALTVAAGVTLTTDDPTPTTTHYAITTPAALAVPLVAIGPGGAMTGFELRNAASTGDGIRAACPDAAAVTLSTLRVAAASGGTPAVRLTSGIHVTGNCAVAMSGVTVEGAATGLLVEAASPGVESTASAIRLTGSTAAGAALVEGRLTFTGGTVDQNANGVLVGTSGTGAPTFSATGTTFSGNAGDAVSVVRGTLVSDACPYTGNGTHVHAQPAAGASIHVTAQDSTGAAKMTGATNSAFRLLAMGAGSTLTLRRNSVTGNDATQSYNVGSGPRRGGGVVLTAPFPGTAEFSGNRFYGNRWDQVLVAASGPDAISLAGVFDCGGTANTFACYDTANAGVGIYSNGAAVDASWNHWTRQPAVYSIDVLGTGISGFDTSACFVSTLVCP